jgi:hypothetical protein
MGLGDALENGWVDAKDVANAVANPVATATEAVGNSMTQAIKDFLIDVTQSMGSVVMKWLNWFLLDPNFYQNPAVDTVTTYFKWFALALLPCLMIYHILEGMIRVNVDGDRIFMKQKAINMIKAILFVGVFPWVIDTLLKMCNWISKYFINQGIAFENSAIGKWLTTGKPGSELAKIMGFSPGATTIFLVLCSLGFVILFLVIAFQTVKLIGEFAFLCCTAPLAAISLVNDDMNVFPVWWREMLAVLFTRPVQIILMYLIINSFATLQLQMVVLGFGLILVLIAGPTFLRQFLYTTGTGRAVTGAAGSGAKLAAKQFILKGGR